MSQTPVNKDRQQEKPVSEQATRDTARPGAAGSPDKESKSAGKNVYGEGNYEAAREYDEATKKFVDSGRVEDAARRAKPANEQEAREMEEAERIGRSRAKEEDPALQQKSPKGGSDQSR